MKNYIINEFKGVTIEDITLQGKGYNLQITAETSTTKAVRLVGISETKTYAPVEGIAETVSRQYLVLQMGFDSSDPNELKRMVRVADDGVETYNNPLTKNTVTEVIFESTNAPLFAWLCSIRDGVNSKTKKANIDGAMVSAIVEPYFPDFTDRPNQRDVVLNRVSFMLLPGDILTTRLRRKVRNLRWVSDSMASFEDIDDKIAHEAHVEFDNKPGSQPNATANGKRIAGRP